MERTEATGDKAMEQEDEFNRARAELERAVIDYEMTAEEARAERRKRREKVRDSSSSSEEEEESEHYTRSRDAEAEGRRRAGLGQQRTSFYVLQELFAFFQATRETHRVLPVSTSTASVRKLLPQGGPRPQHQGGRV